MPRSTPCARTSRQIIDEQIRLCEIPGAALRGAGARPGVQGGVRAAGAPERPHRRGGQRARRASGPAGDAAPGDERASRHGVSRRDSGQGDAVGAGIAGPGIADDCRGLAVVLGVIRAMNEARVETAGPVTFVGTVGRGRARRSARREAPLQDRAGRPHRQLRLGGRRGHVDHQDRGRQPPLPGHVQGPGRAQLRGLRDRQSGARARPRDCDDRRPRGPARSEDDVQRRTGRRRNVGQLHRRPRRGWKSTCVRPTRPR